MAGTYPDSERLDASEPSNLHPLGSSPSVRTNLWPPGSCGGAACTKLSLGCACSTIRGDIRSPEWNPALFVPVVATTVVVPGWDFPCASRFSHRVVGRADAGLQNQSFGYGVRLPIGAPKSMPP